MKISDKFKDADGAAAWDAVVKYVMVNRNLVASKFERYHVAVTADHEFHL